MAGPAGGGNSGAGDMLRDVPYTVVEVVHLCAHCGRELRPGRRKSARFCDGVHRQRAYRRRRVAVPETRPRLTPRRGATLRDAYLNQLRRDDLVGFLLLMHDEWEAELRDFAARLAERGDDGLVAATLAAANAALPVPDEAPYHIPEVARGATRAADASPVRVRTAPRTAPAPADRPGKSADAGELAEGRPPTSR
jgi:hypothetical protein